MWVTSNKFIAAVLRDVQRDLPPPEQPYTLTCIGPIWAQNCPVPSVPTLFLTLMPSSAMASGCTPLGPQTLLRVYVLLLCHVITVSCKQKYLSLCHVSKRLLL